MTDRTKTLEDNADHLAGKTGTGAVVGGAAGGVAGGAAAGALAGGLTGPAGAAIGAVVGAVAGAVIGRRSAVDPVEEDSYWRDNFASQPYSAGGGTYDEFQPAYRYGIDSYSKYPNRSFDEVEPDLNRDWATARGTSSLEWERAKHATRDAWHRVGNAAERAIPGDSDRDGR